MASSDDMPSITTFNEAIEACLDELELLQAMYPTELRMDDGTLKRISTLRAYCQESSISFPSAADDIAAELHLTIGDGGLTRDLLLFVELALTHETQDCSFKLRARQPEWLTKAQALDLTIGIPTDIVSAIEHFQERATSLLATKAGKDDTQPEILPDPLVRVWFYFPSISTREKRDDLVRFAPGYRLTGFLLAGKPGILCVEGTAKDVDEYMRYIKSVSWSDIPSQHKKVSERYRESGDGTVRVFQDMSEITDALEKRGERSNRGDMKALEAWLDSRGLANAFSKVLL